LIFSIAMDADNLFYVKFIANYAPTFFGYIISVLAMVVTKCGLSTKLHLHQTIKAFSHQKIQILILATFQIQGALLKFIYSEKATKLCEIFTLLLTGTT
jgi:hypothetical protein